MNCKPQLSELQPGQTAVIRNLSAEGAMRRRLQDMGMIEGTQVECIGRSPLGDPAAYLVRGAVVALRKSDAGSIEAAPAVCPFRSHATVPLGTAGR